MYDDIVNLGEWEGTAGKPAKMVSTITYDSLADFDIRQTNSAVDYIKQHANSAQPFFLLYRQSFKLGSAFEQHCTAARNDERNYAARERSGNC